MTEETRTVVHVVETRVGWWDVKTQTGAILGQFTTEFQARDAGRMNATRLRADLAVHQTFGPTLYWAYDERDDTMKPLPPTVAADER